MPWPKIEPAELRHKITLLAPTAALGAAGTAATYAPWLTTRAAITTLRTAAKSQSGQITSNTNMLVTMRYRPGVTARMRVQTATATYAIDGIENVEERNVLLKLTCLRLG